MNIRYNNESPASDMVTFTDVPNILTFDDNNQMGQEAYIELSFIGNLYSATTSEGQWEIVIMGETITSTLEVSKSVNKNFYVAQNQVSTAAYVARALRNCPTINASFTVEHSSYKVTLRTRTPMAVNLVVSSNIPSGFLVINSYNGVSPSVYEGATIGVDVYSDGRYITTLEKKMYNGETAFDVSPVITTLAQVGRTVPYNFVMHSLNNGEYSLLSNNVGTNYVSVGYMVNQGLKFIPLNGIDLAANVGRGSDKGVTNRTVLYVYDNTIPFSLYFHNTAGMTYTVKYLDSAFNVLHEDELSWRNPDSSQKLKDFEITMNGGYFSRTFYVDIIIGSIHLRYNVIKPLKATEYSQRICWRNSYGGISFFDFTGQRSETRNFETSTYDTNIFGFYNSSKNELKKIYDVDVDYVVTLKSHLMEHDAKYLFNDMIQSSELWTIINGETYSIILDDVSVEEQQNNNIYEATVKYRYSAKPSLF